jgi:acetoin utilization deacetylase AcuC-like enzyme
MEYSAAGHPERPARIRGTLARLRTQKELAIEWAKPADCDETAVLRAHSAAQVARVDAGEDFDSDTPNYPNIAEHARRSVGGALAALASARAGELATSLMRPPGHHATREQAMGFCYFNSIAIAALHALAMGAKRVAVYDFDVHHGNGTEAILLNVPGAAFFSIHQSPCYPGTGRANMGNNCFNFPVAPRIPRDAYRKVLATALDGVKKFQPEVVAVSAGFDAYARDPLAQETLEAEDFFWMGAEIKKLDVPVFSVLEGGYSDDLPELVLAYLKGISG